MLTENGSQVDYDALNELLRRADVITIGFTFTPARLLIDTRSNETDGPLVTMVGPVATVQERYLWLGKNRPSFGAPEAFSFFVWPQPVATLRDSSGFAILLRRLRAHPNALAAEGLAAALDGLAHEELRSLQNAVRGAEPWATVWEAARTAG